MHSEDTARISTNSHDIPLLDATKFQQLSDGTETSLFVLRNTHGSVAEITNYGARLVSLWVADKEGMFSDVVLGFDNILDYQNSSEKYFGATIGQYANRIAHGKFTLQDKEYNLATNDGMNHLHGGNKGFGNVVWKARQIDSQSIELHYLSRAEEEGYPGNLSLHVTYRLTNTNELRIDYRATTDQTTVINLTHHSFFNLNGGDCIDDYILHINAHYYTPVDQNLIPTGELAAVEGSPFNFISPKPIGQNMDEPHEQLTFAKGYDHNFVLNQSNTALNYAATVVDPKSGRKIEVFTSEPGLQFYGGNFLDGTITGKYGTRYKHRSAFCLETQHFPDSPNHPHFPSTILEPGQAYSSVSIYRFSVEN